MLARVCISLSVRLNPKMCMSSCKYSGFSPEVTKRPGCCATHRSATCAVDTLCTAATASTFGFPAMHFLIGQTPMQARRVTRSCHVQIKPL
eukprot:m.107136 g.107136  ORF g.107136 m.107136 type:complete len:91 (+) comp12734_c0_seq2:34-306(+)